MTRSCVVDMMNNRRRSHSATRLEIRNRFAPRFSSSIRIDATKLRTQVVYMYIFQKNSKLYDIPNYNTI
ncbi:unnamed protein product [Onchocerca flexuosa]|uniref:Ovule protein n=1 Tax=Onchocerca flexuosa TaxID=387005 RepID=A0A183HT43_9BILA|nr:unnamed protein product [Onchocerca flexuosa]